MIELKGYIVVPAADLAAVEQALPQHIALTRAEPGNLSFEVTADEQTPRRFNVHETFVDRAAFDAHQARVKESEWGRITQHVERHYEVEER